MVLPSTNVTPFLQPNLAYDNDQEDIITRLNNLAWEAKTSYAQYMSTIFVIEEEEAIAECLDKALKM